MRATGILRLGHAATQGPYSSHSTAHDSPEHHMSAAHVSAMCSVCCSKMEDLHHKAHALTSDHAHRPSGYYDVEEAFRRDSCKSLTAMPVVGSKGEALGAVSLGLQQHVNLSTK